MPHCSELDRTSRDVKNIVRKRESSLDESTDGNFKRRSIKRESYGTDSFREISLRDCGSKENLLIKDFLKQFNISKSIIKGVESLKIDQLNEVQKEVLPFLTKNCMSDLLVQTKPYSSTNLAYLIAALDRIDPTINHPQVVIVSATSELVLKIGELARKISKYTDIKVHSLVGGKNTVGYVEEHLVCATIGNLLFCLGRNRIFDIRKIRILILNEFCTLVSSDKFANYVHELTRKLNKCTQVQLFTSCFDTRFALDVIRGYMVNLKKLSLISKEKIFRNVYQFFTTYRTEQEKYNCLLNAIKNREKCCPKILVFVIGKKVPYLIHKKLKEDGIDTNILISDLSIDERIESIEEFRKSKKNILIANFPLTVGTLQCVDDHSVMVINYDLPLMSKIFCIEYYFRISECAFYRKPGVVVNLFEAQDIKFLFRLENFFEIKMKELSCSDLKYCYFLKKK